MRARLRCGLPLSALRIVLQDDVGLTLKISGSYLPQERGSPITVVGKVAEAVLRGLMYLYDVHRIIHRGEPGPSGFGI